MSTDRLSTETSRRAWRAWGVVVLMTLAYVLSFVDRRIFGLLIPPIKSSMHLSNTEVGLLMGPAFAILYVGLGWPIGWLADRANRRNIVVTGVSVWSIMTAMCGLSRSFGQLFVSRIGVGVGEATLNPSVLSLIGDLFPKANRPRAIAFYMGAVPFGTGLAYLFGGQLAASLSKAGTVDIPVFGHLEGWQAAFLAVGAPGLIMALVICAVREPARQTEVGERNESLSPWAALKYLGTRWTAYLPIALGMCVATTAAYSNDWNAVLFQQSWGWPVNRMGLWLGFAYIVAGPLGAVAGGFISHALTVRGHVASTYRACWIGIALTSLGAASYPLMPSPELALVLMTTSIFGNSLCTGMGSASVIALAPNRLRAQSVALYLMIINLIGPLYGPTTVGVLIDHVFTGTKGVGSAMATVQIGIGVPALLIMWAGWKPFVREITAMRGKT